MLDDREMKAIRDAARRQGMTVSAWVRRALSAALRASRDPASKLGAVRAAARHDFPTAHIEQMLAEIERGYAGS
ncbi:MAG: antitoxin [Actinomycetota bacterium]